MSNRVYVGNLAWSVSWQDLKDHMRDAGDVQYSKVLTDRDGRSKDVELSNLVLSRVLRMRLKS
ncbi:hypothetical protein QTG54_002077 [Skeletonema marinoi]|uniref:RRM domain-containing protein n=1 Tax=Skeletonema marinoi TaxID=267567 RepID=A0AAD8YIR1_9STRA|nr:hypothetical protein QTG54_002077 [Skeletonema marinoi]